MDVETGDMLMRAVLVTAIADGVVRGEEQSLIRRLRRKLGIDDARLQALVAELRSAMQPDALLPSRSEERREALLLMVITAQIDGEIDGREREVLQKMADRLGFDAPAFSHILETGIARAHRLRGDARIGEAVAHAVTAVDSAAARARAEQLVQIMYAQYFDRPSVHRELDELVALGSSAAIPLIRAFESYRRPRPPATPAQFKALLAETLGRIGDQRAVYYLASTVALGDEEDDETNTTELRITVAKALSLLVGERFSPDAAGVRAAREWWSGVGGRSYQSLSF